MKVLHLVNIFFTIPYFLGEQLLYFDKKGYSMHIICSPSEELKEYSIAYNFSYEEIPILRKISLYKDCKAIWRICRYIKNEKVDVVTGHTPKGALLAMIASFIMHVPIRLYFRHGIVYETSKGFKRLILILIDFITSLLSTKIVCVSPSVFKRSLEDNLNSKDKQIVLYKGTCNGINTSKFCKNSIEHSIIEKIKNEYEISDQNFVIGYTGRLVKDKGIIELIEALEILRTNHKNVILLLVGMLDERDALPNDIIQSIDTKPYIKITGYVNNSFMPNYYAMMDVFVLPSYREGFPTSILEASSMKIPVITTKATGCIDAILEGNTGLFVEHDKTDIANAILNLMKSPDLRKKMGQSGRNFVVNNFSPELVWNEIEKLYHSVK